MMGSLLFIAFGLCLLVVQTAVMPRLGNWSGCYDLLVPLVVFLGLRRRFWDGLAVVLALGLVVDGLSCAAPGYYLTAYLWIWALMRWLIRFLRVANTFLLPLVMAGAVLIENLVLLAVPLLLAEQTAIAASRALSTVAAQMVWALLTGPLLLAVFGQSQLRLRRYQVRAAARRAVKDE
jgi:hypothetical protein